MSAPGGIAASGGVLNGPGTRVESGRFRHGAVNGWNGGGLPQIDFAPASAVANSILYNRDLLRPRARHAVRSGCGRPLGVLAPRGWVEADKSSGAVADGVSGSAGSWWNRTESLVDADLDTRMEVRLRYLQLVGEAGTFSAVAVPREATVAFTLGELVGCGIVVTVDGGDRLQARFLVSASIAVSPFELYKITVRVENAVRLDGDEVRMTWDRALLRCLLSTHLLLGVDRGSFLSLIEPPPWALRAVDLCRNVRAFPVLAGPEGTSDTVLSAPVILHDHPRVADETCGCLPVLGSETIA